MPLIVSAAVAPFDVVVSSVVAHALFARVGIRQLAGDWAGTCEDRPSSLSQMLG
jgi:hypothetical protein